LLYSHVRADGSARFFLPDAGYRSAFVTGAFCDWRTPGVGLKRVPEGWLGDVDALRSGANEYKFVADGRWLSDPINLCRVGDPRGDGNSVLHARDGRGALVHLRFHSQTLGEPRGYVVYVPPGYHAGARAVPTLYLLHGALDWERTWCEKGALADSMDGLVGDGSVGDMLVVMPFEGGGLHRGDTRVVDYLARDLVSHIDEQFHTIAEAEHRALDGLSTGGFTSLVLGAWRPDRWRSIGTMSGSHDGRSFDAIRGCARDMSARGQRYLVSAGLDEPHVGDARAVAAALREAGVGVDWREAQGGHDWPLWRGLVSDHLRFHWSNVRPDGHG
jgi:enterochelin esterase-like enzyme